MSDKENIMATVLVSLRLLQTKIDVDGAESIESSFPQFEHGGKLLSIREINDLCANINMDQRLSIEP